MNWVDGAIVVVIIAYTVAGSFRGFVWELSIFCTIVGGLLAGLILNYPVGMLLGIFMDDIGLARIIAFFIVFMTVSVVFRLLASYFKAKIKQNKWEKSDRQLGGLFGFLEALLIVAFVTTGVALYSADGRAVKGSLLGRQFIKAGLWVLPRAAADRIFPRIRDAATGLGDEVNRRINPEESLEEIEERERRRREAIRRARDGEPERPPTSRGGPVTAGGDGAPSSEGGGDR